MPARKDARCDSLGSCMYAAIFMHVPGCASFAQIAACPASFRRFQWDARGEELVTQLARRCSGLLAMTLSMRLTLFW